MYRIVSNIEYCGVKYKYNKSDRYHVKGSVSILNNDFDFKEQFIWDTHLKKIIYFNQLCDQTNGLSIMFDLMKFCEGLNKENELYEKEIKDYGTL